MIYTTLTKKAMNIMYDAHKNQKDKAGVPYIFHPIHVAEQMSSEKETIVALLHDVLEDTNYSIEKLKIFGSEVIEALLLLNHNDNISYYDYIKNLSVNKIARTVKIKDLEHNLDLTRLEVITEKDITRANKYKKCLEYLINIDTSEEKI